MIERRKEPRLWCSDLVGFRTSGRGRAAETVVILEDISPSGAHVVVEEPIGPQTIVQLRCGTAAYAGVVRYSIASELGYDVGIEFVPRGAWNAGEFTPKHLFDPQSMERE